MATSSSAPAAGGSRVIVIGAGIVGTCCTLELCKKGLEVTLVDPVPPGGSCSFGNAGVLASRACVPAPLPGTLAKVPRWLFDPEGPLSIRPAYLPRLAPWLLRFLRAGRAARIPAAADALLAINGPTVGLYKRLAKEAGAPELIRDCAHLQVSRDPGTFDLDNLEWRLRRERGATLTPLAGGEIREVEPEIAPAYRSGVMIAAQGTTTNPGRPALPDSLPVIGPAPTAAKVVFAFGHGRTGLTAAPMTARIVAGMVVGEPLDLDVRPYRATRFQGRKGGGCARGPAPIPRSRNLY